MIKAASIGVSDAIEKIISSEMGMILLQSDGLGWSDLLDKKSNGENPIGLYDSNHHIICNLYRLLYQTNNNHSVDVAKNRMDAINDLFYRWTENGHNKRNAKNPFRSKAFRQYLDEIQFTKADYMFLLIEK